MNIVAGEGKKREMLGGPAEGWSGRGVSSPPAATDPSVRELGCLVKKHTKNDSPKTHNADAYGKPNVCLVSL